MTKTTGVPTGEAPTRTQRRKARTRAALLDAAKALFARQGVEATTIAEIAAQADVGFGSFYNHFDSKDEIAADLVEETVAAQGAHFATLAERLTDPAEVVSVAHRHLVRMAHEDAAWAWLLVRLDLSYRVASRALATYARADLERGVGSGRFNVSDVDVALAATGGALLGVMRAVLDGGIGVDADVRHAEGVLRMLGLEASEAAEVARRPLP